jgi:hypothetical protein
MSVYKVTFSIYPDSQGYTSYTYTVLDDATGTPAPLAADADAKAAANKAAAEQAALDKAVAAEKTAAK